MAIPPPPTPAPSLPDQLISLAPFSDSNCSVLSANPTIIESGSCVPSPTFPNFVSVTIAVQGAYYRLSCSDSGCLSCALSGFVNLTSGCVQLTTAPNTFGIGYLIDKTKRLTVAAYTDSNCTTLMNNSATYNISSGSCEFTGSSYTLVGVVQNSLQAVYGVACDSTCSTCAGYGIGLLNTCMSLSGVNFYGRSILLPSPTTTPVQTLLIVSSDSNDVVVSVTLSILTILIIAIGVAIAIFFWKRKRDQRSLSDAAFSSMEQLQGVEIVNKLAEGNFGEVWVGNWNNFKVALKSPKNASDVPSFVAEVNLLNSLKFPGIVQVYGLYRQKEKVYAVLEFCERGSLLDFLKSDAGESLNLQQLTSIAISCTKSVQFLHSRQIIHRDIAARNFLVTTSMEIKLSDFGMSRKQENVYYSKKDVAIPIRWSPPEVLLKNKYSYGSDRYSFGILLFEIFSKGVIPFRLFTNEQLQESVPAGKVILERVGPDVVSDLISRLTVVDPHQRPSLEIVVQTLEGDTNLYKFEGKASITPQQGSEVKQHEYVNVSKDLINGNETGLKKHEYVNVQNNH